MRPSSAASAIPAATTTFRESTPSAIGMRSLTSAASRASGSKARPLRAEDQDERPVPAGRGGISCERRRDPIGRERGDLEPAAAKQAEVRGPGLQPCERQVERRAHRRPDGFSIERIAASRGRGAGPPHRTRRRRETARRRCPGWPRTRAPAAGGRRRTPRAAAGRRGASRARGSPDGNRIPVSDASSDFSTTWTGHRTRARRSERPSSAAGVTTRERGS